METDKSKVTKEDYLRKKGELPPEDLGTIFFFTSTRDKVSEVEEVVVWKQWITHGWRGDNRNVEIQNYEFKEPPYRASLWTDKKFDTDHHTGSGFGDLWSSSTFVSKDKAVLDLERDKEIERIEKKYHTVEEGTTVERSEFSEFSNRFNVVIKTSYSLTKEDWKTLCTIMETPCENGTSTGWWQFRSGRSEEFDRSGTLRWEVCDKLFDMGFLRDDDMDWNLTYYVTDLGKQVYEQSKKK